VLLIAVAVMAVAATRRSDGGSEASTADPCRIFTKAEVRKYFNIEPRKDEPSERYLDRHEGIPPLSVVGMEYCRVIADRIVFVGITPTLGQEAFAKWQEEMSANQSATTTSVGGLGTKALFVRGRQASDSPYPADVMVVLQGDKLFAVTTTRIDSGLERTRLLFSKGLERL
jgi:hypothetical protein